jgi:hypothetical protein
LVRAVKAVNLGFKFAVIASAVDKTGSLRFDVKSLTAAADDAA